MRILIIGAGGHGRVVADTFLGAQRNHPGLEICGFLDDNPDLQRKRFRGVTVLGPLSLLEETDHDRVFVAIGDNRVRAKIFERLTESGDKMATAVHPSAVVSEDAEIGPGTLIGPNVSVNTGSRIGRNVILNTACGVDHDCRIGDHSHLGPGVHLGGHVRIGEGALLGVGSVVIPGCSIGAWSVIGAGSAVIDDIPGGVTAVGVPARVNAR